MSEQTQANRLSDPTLRDPACAISSVLETCDRIVRLKIPNFLRLYLNPFVAQTCVALSEIVHTAWPASRKDGPRPSFLANSGEEALSGAIKLARYTVNVRQSVREKGHSDIQSAEVLLIDDLNVVPSFEAVDVKVDPDTTSHVVFIPGVQRIASSQLRHSLSPQTARARILVVVSLSSTTDIDDLRTTLRQFQTAGGLLIVAVGSDWEVNLLSECDQDFRNALPSSSQRRETLAPDIVVFDSSFTNHGVPFGAFCAARDLYAQWTRKGMATFHSTTYQPNTISTMHFLKCLEDNSPAFFGRLQGQLKSLLVDHELLRKTFRELFSPSLSRLISASGFGDEDVSASGHFVRVGSRRLFDGIGGVACSIRGHNPERWSDEIESIGQRDRLRHELSERLLALTGLRYFVPAVSGGSSVEHALKLALIAQAPRRTVVALRGGFGGKTLLALTGTSKETYKKQLEPLYEHVVYIDPFSADAVESLTAIVAQQDVAVIQLELIQGVGGVREVPRTLLQAIQKLRDEQGILIFVDEIQTGMFRTGPFVRSTEVGISPDLLTIGKGTSDMMFPFALTLYGDRVKSLLEKTGSELPMQLRRRNDFEIGFRSILNTLRRSASDDMFGMVHAAGQQFEESLRRHLQNVSVVKDIRVFGLLIGIELSLSHTLIGRLKPNAAQLYLAQMMQHPEFPLLMGYCQYEPSILKFTPPLSVTSEETEAVCKSIADSLRSSSLALLGTGMKAIWRARKA